MAAFTKFDSFVEALCEKVHNLGADTLKIALTNVAPDPATDAVFADLTEITPGNGYSAGGSTVTITTSAQTAGVYKLIGTDLVFTAAGGAIATFQYAVLYNDTATNDELIGYWDQGAPVNLSATETYTVDFSATNGILQLT